MCQHAARRQTGATAVANLLLIVLRLKGGDRRRNGSIEVVGADRAETVDAALRAALAM